MAVQRVCLSNDDGFKTHKLHQIPSTQRQTWEHWNSESQTGKSLLLFVLVLRRKRRGSAQTRAHYRCWNVHDLKKITAHSRIREKPLLPTAAVSLSKGWCATLLPTFLNCIQEHKGTFEPKGDHSFQEGTECSTKLKDSDKPTHKKNGSEAPQITH